MSEFHLRKILEFMDVFVRSNKTIKIDISSKWSHVLSVIVFRIELIDVYVKLRNVFEFSDDSDSFLWFKDWLIRLEQFNQNFLLQIFKINA